MWWLTMDFAINLDNLDVTSDDCILENVDGEFNMYCVTSILTIAVTWVIWIA